MAHCGLLQGAIRVRDSMVLAAIDWLHSHARTSRRARSLHRLLELSALDRSILAAKRRWQLYDAATMRLSRVAAVLRLAGIDPQKKSYLE